MAMDQTYLFHINSKYISVWVDSRQFLRLFLSQRLKTKDYLFKDHLKEKEQHWLWVDMQYGNIWCAICKDYVHDTELKVILHRKIDR